MDKRLFVAGLPYSFDDKALADLFAGCGTVVSATVINDRETGRSKGFGFVEMSTLEESQSAISKLNDTEVEGRKIIVNVARPREERPRDNFGGGGQRRFGNDRRRSGSDRGGAPRGRNRY